MAQRAPTPGIHILTVRGIPIYLHLSWFIIFALITITLAKQFTSLHPGWTQGQHYALGVITSILFFASVLFHELCHSMVALRYRIPVKSITLFVFGGLAGIAREPDNAKQEFTIAIAGPLSSMFLAGCFWLATRFFHGNDMVVAACAWLWEINLILAIFNLVPGFPLDGGRVLRGIAWGITGSFDRATRIATSAGKFFAYALIVLGAWQALNGNWVGGLWMVFIGWFLLSAAQESYAQVAVRHTLTGVSAKDVMSHDVPTVSRDMSIEEYVHEVLRTGVLAHIVVGAGAPVGIVSLQAARTTPREEWPSTSIQAVMLPVERIQFAAPDEPVLAILERMQSTDMWQMPVISNGNILGMISRDAILRVLHTRLQMGHLAHQ